MLRTEKARSRGGQLLGNDFTHNAVDSMEEKAVYDKEAGHFVRSEALLSMVLLRCSTPGGGVRAGISI